MTSKDRKIFAEAKNGFGFFEVEQTPEGVYCTGCYTVHKRPTKMYSHDRNKTAYCAFAVVRFFNPEEQLS